MTRHQAESNININTSLRRNPPIGDSNVKQWSHSLMILLHYMWTKLNNETRGQFECDVLGFAFVLISFRFVHMHRGWKNFWGRWTGDGGSWKLDNFHGRHMSIVGAIAVSYPLFLLMILVQNFMLIKNHIETWVWKSTEMKLFTVKVL